MDRSNLYEYADGSRFAGKSTEKIFNEITENNVWVENESVSGIGSSLIQAAEIIKKLPGIFENFQIKSLFDVPCGDFNWFQKIDLSKMRYLGGDIVQDLIERNDKKIKKNNINFIHFNLLEDEFDAFDMIFCRDCLVHLSFKDIFKAITNIKKNNSTYLMTTTFPDQESNKDIQTGGWRPLNLEWNPFKFPKPIFILNEKCTEKNGVFQDKSLGLWKVADLDNAGSRTRTYQSG